MDNSLSEMRQIGITSKAKRYKSNNLTNSDSKTKLNNLIDLTNSDSKTKLNSDTEMKIENSLNKFINKKKIVEVKYIKKITETKTTKQINHETITYDSKQYVVCCIPFKTQYKLFVIDFDKSENVIKRTWHYRSSGSYVSSPEYVEKIKKELYLHNLIMDKLTFNGKGQQQTIDHINRIGTDNRKENLRNLTSQTAQNFNQNKRERKMTLPENSNININEIPKNIYYAKSIGAHGDYFYIELKGIPVLCQNGKKYTWKSTKSKSISLNIKLQQTINKLLELKNTHVELSNIVFTYALDEQRQQSTDTYNNILNLSHYPKNVINENLRDSNGKYIMSDNDEPNNDSINDESNNDSINDEPNINNSINDESLIELKNDELKNASKNLIIKQQSNLAKITIMKSAGKKTDKLPTDCGITIEQIPKYCYYRPESEKRGCKFVIDRHPKLVEQGIRQWSTTESKKLSIHDKFKILTDKLTELQN